MRASAPEFPNQEIKRGQFSRHSAEEKAVSSEPNRPKIVQALAENRSFPVNEKSAKLNQGRQLNTMANIANQRLIEVRTHNAMQTTSKSFEPSTSANSNYMNFGASHPQYISRQISDRNSSHNVSHPDVV